MNYLTQTDYVRRVAANIKALRLARGYTQTALAERAEMSLNHVAKIERGDTSPSSYSLYKLGHALGASVDSLGWGAVP